MPIHLFDRLTGAEKPLLPSSPGQVRLAPCAPEAHAWAHVERTRRQVMADVLSRHLRASGLRVAQAAGEQDPVDIALDDLVCATPHAVHMHDSKLDVEVSDADRARELFDQLEPEVLRYFALGTHYRAPLALRGQEDASGSLTGFAQLEETERQLTYLYATKRRLQDLPDTRIIEVDWKPPADIESLESSLAEALDADLDTPHALALIARFLIAVNALCDAAPRKKGKVARSHVDDAIEGFASIAGRLVLGTDEPRAFLERVRNRRAAARSIEPTLVESRIRERALAREKKDFAAADAVLAELSELGVDLLDLPSGTEWSVR